MEKPRVSRTLVRAVAYNQGHVLLLQRSDDERWRPGEWHLPAGSLEAWEDPDHAVRRELFEEAGLMSGLVQVVGTSTFFVENDKAHEDWINLNYLVAVDKSEIKMPPEIQAYNWVKLEEAAFDTTLPWADRRAMLQVLNLKPSIRAILGSDW